MNKPLVSIQIPTYNQKEYIKETVESALIQTYESIQIIVTDDCSNYDIKEFLKDYSSISLVEIVVNSKNKGRVLNYHDSLYNQIKGKYFINLDGDDYFTDTKFIEYGVSLLENNSKNKPLLFQGDHNIEKIKLMIPEFELIDEYSILIDGNEYLKKITDINEFRHSSTIFETKKAKSIGFYNFDCLFTDFNSASRLLLEDGSIIVSSKHVSEWRKHQNNATFSLGISNYKNELASINNIIQAAKNKIDKKALNLIKRKLDKKILKGVVLGFDQKKNFKSQFVFFMKYFKFRIFYIRLFIRFVYKSIT